MAIAVVQRGELHSATDAASPTIGGVVLTAGRMYVVMSCSSIASGDAPAIDSISASAGTITWEKRTTTGSSETFSSRRVELWFGKCTASGTATITVNYAATSTQGDIWIGEITGCKTTGTNGADFCKQAVCLASSNTSDVAATITLAAFSSSSNRPLGFYTHRANEATAHDTTDGYTELDDGAHGSPSGGFSVQWHDTVADADPSWSWASGAQNGGIAIEIDAEAGNVTVEVPVATLTLTAFAPNLDLGVTPGNATLATTTFAPQANLGVVPPTASLTTSTFAPIADLGIVVPVASLATEAFAPTVTAGGGGNVEVEVPTAELATSTFAPLLDLGVVVPVATLTATPFVPVIGLGIVVPRVDLTTTLFVPLIETGIVVPRADLALNAFAPTVTAPNNITIEVPAATLTLTGFEPTVGEVVVFTPGKLAVDGNPQPLLALAKEAQLRSFAAQTTLRRRRRALAPLGAQANPPVIEQVDKSKVVLQSDFLNIVETSSGTEIEITRDADGRMRFYLP